MELEVYRTNDLSALLLREINDFLDSQETSHLFQFPQWSVSGTRLALMRENGRIQWFGSFGTHYPLGSALPWVKALVANRGPVCDDPELWHKATGAFVEQLSREGITYFDAIPEWARTSDDEALDYFCNSGWQPLRRERASLRLDIARGEDEIFANLRKNSRYEVRRAERLGVDVAPAYDDAAVEEFLALHARLASRKGFEADAPEDLRRAMRWLTSDHWRGALLLARFENVIYGGAVIGRSGKRCWYVWGASDKHEHFNVGHILQWRALLWAKSHDCTEYDFGGYTPGATSGPAWFKAGFGGKVVRLVPPHRKILRRGYYRIYNFASRVRGFGQNSSIVPWVNRALFPAVESRSSGI